MRNTCSTCRSTDRNPVTVFMRTGKNVMSPVTTTLGVRPNPKATTSAGAMATTGVTLRTTASGVTPRRTRPDSPTSTASRTAQTVPATRPSNASCSVVHAFAR